MEDNKLRAVSYCLYTSSNPDWEIVGNYEETEFDTMLEDAISQLKDGGKPIIHSDYAEEKTMPKNLITSCILIIRIQFFGIVFRVSQARRLLSLYQRSSTAFRHRQLWEQTC